jgi:hypothetical protein
LVKPVVSWVWYYSLKQAKQKVNLLWLYMCMYFRWQQVLPKRLHFFFTKTAYFFSQIPERTYTSPLSSDVRYTRIQYINLLDKSWVTKHHKWYHRFIKKKYLTIYFGGFQKLDFQKLDCLHETWNYTKFTSQSSLKTTLSG